jgi:hypothetical protein
MNKMNKGELILSSLLILCFFLGTYFRFQLTDFVLIKDWNSRDFDRAFNLIEGLYIPLAGPEVNVGGRLPGPFLYFLLALPLLIKKSYESIFYFNFLLNIASVAGFYFVLKKHFNYFTCVIGTILALFCLPHMGAVGFPINPSFLFPFIVLFIWAYLEFILNKKSQYVPIMVLTICLGVQLHYSILIFAFIPIILALLWRIKIEIKPLFWSFLICLVSFTPYLFYKINFFHALGEGIPTFSKHTFSTLLQTPFLGHTLEGITLKNGLWRYQLFPKGIAGFYLTLTLLALSVLFLIIIQKIRKQGFHSCKKEISLFLLFYFPGILFEFSLPFKGHFPHNWYSFIFLFPQILVISYFISWLEQRLKKTTTRTTFFSGLILIFVYLLINAHQEVSKYKAQSKENLFSDNFKLRRYKEFNGYSQLLKTFMKKLNLTPEEYSRRVYFEGLGMNGGPQSMKLLQLVSKNIEGSASTSNKTPKKCFYIRKSDMLGSSEVQRLKILKNDKSVISTPPYEVTVADGKLIRRFLVTEYTTNINQSCYNNSFNKYAVRKDIRDLLLEGHDINPRSESEIKVISFEEKFDSSNQLKQLKGNYLIYFKNLKFPFRFRLELNRIAGGYSIRCHLLFYRFHVQTHHISNQVIYLKNNLGLSILSPNTLPTHRGFSNKSWFRGYNLPIKEPFIKDQYNIKLLTTIQPNLIFRQPFPNSVLRIEIPLNGDNLRKISISNN